MTSSKQQSIPLSTATLAGVGERVPTPAYDREQLRRGIVHIGVGGFHRAHLATYVDELCRAGHRDWSIVGAGVLPGDERIASVLDQQDGLYALITRGSGGQRVEVIGSIVDFIHAHTDEGRASLVGQIADPQTQIVSLTVTEGGYPVDDLTREYLPESRNAGPNSSFGIIAAGLAQRRRDGASGLTILSCDNILSNGAAARAATLGEAARLDAGLADWVESSTSFPNSMVDRITPATTDADREWLAAEHGVADLWPVVTEPFRQWVIEDNFAGDRLPLEELDVLATADVEPYEFMKLRLLNASHSCLAYLAALQGFQTVDAAMADPLLRRYIEAFLSQEARPVLPPVAGVDLGAYTASLIERFSNPAIGDQIARLCQDGSAKFPKFLLPTVRAQLENGGPVHLSALALAGWCEYLLRVDNPAPDPLLDGLVAHAQQSRSEPGAFLRFEPVFGPDLAQADRFAGAFVAALQGLRAGQIASSIKAVLREG